MTSKRITRVVSNDKKEQFFENFIRNIIDSTLNFTPLFDIINELKQQIETAIKFTNEKLEANKASQLIDDPTVRQMVRELVDEYIDMAFDRLSEIHDDATIWGEDLVKPTEAAKSATPASKPSEELIVELSNAAIKEMNKSLDNIISSSTDDTSDDEDDIDIERPGFGDDSDDSENNRYRHDAEGGSSDDNDSETKEKRTRRKSEDNFIITPGATSIHGLNDSKLIERLTTEANIQNIIELAAFVKHADLRGRHYGPATIGKLKRFLNLHGYKFSIRTDPSTHPTKAEKKLKKSAEKIQEKPNTATTPTPLVTNGVIIPENACYPINIAAAEQDSFQFLNNDIIAEELHAIGIHSKALLIRTSGLTLKNAGMGQYYIDWIDYGLKLCGFRNWDSGEKKFNPPAAQK
ncbi:MAG: hypothetical protein WCO55_04805 [Candidatus Falkowbacteria bacterium]